MAQKIILIDDITKQPGAESITFSLDGVTYTIDLGPENADKLRNSLTPFIEAGRVVSTKTKRSTAAKTSVDAERMAAIRAWGRANGYDIAERGRISREVVAAFNAAH